MIVMGLCRQQQFGIGQPKAKRFNICLDQWRGGCKPGIDQDIAF
jgi:hypothetical protein